MASMISLFFVISEAVGVKHFYDFWHAMIFGKYLLDFSQKISKTGFLTIRILDFGLFEDMKVSIFFLYCLEICESSFFENPDFSWEVRIFPKNAKFLNHMFDQIA